MRCVNCGAAEMVQDVRDLPHTYKGRGVMIPSVAGLYCPRCNESVHTEEESKHFNDTMLAFNKEINATAVDPAFISETRKALKLGQKEAAELFGGGPNAFSRYENGKTSPPMALVQLFKILSKHPELLDELRTKVESTPPSRKRLQRKSRAHA